MPIGRPDYGIGAAQELVMKGEDMNELAARLGSLAIWSRTGTMFLIDTFKDGIYKWNKGVAPPSYIISSRKTCFLSPYSARFYMNATPYQNIYIYRVLPLYLTTTIGFETFISSSNTNQYIQLDLRVSHLRKEYYFSVKIDLNSRQLSLYDKTSNWIVFGVDIQLYPIENLFNSFKLIVSPLNGEYLEFRLNSKIYNLSNYYCYNSNTEDYNHVYVYIKPHNIEGFTSVMNCGGVIVTQNE